jgi:hypothetical protein
MSMDPGQAGWEASESERSGRGGRHGGTAEIEALLLLLPPLLLLLLLRLRFATNTNTIPGISPTSIGRVSHRRQAG